MKGITLFLLFLLPLSATSQHRPEQTPPSVTPFVLGEIRTLRSDILREARTLNIYLPADYNADDTTHYPVVFLLDGSADEDFIHIAGLYQYCAFPWVARAPASIVVGIANTDRKRDFTYPTAIAADKRAFPNTGGSAAFIRFLEEELQPHMAAAYRTTTQRTLIGQSLGGLLATEILLKKPQLFTHYLIVSPSLWWDDGSLLKTSADAYRKAAGSTRVFLAVGKEGLGLGSKPHVMEVDAHLLEARLKEAGGTSARVHLEYLPAENHATILHTAAMMGLQWLHGK